MLAAGSSYDLVVPPSHAFVSHARNREDVVLWRALGRTREGRYVELTTSPGTAGSVGRAFTDRGWTGSSVDLSTVTGAAGGPVTEAALGEALVRQGWSAEHQVHFLAVTAPGSTPAVLSALDLKRRRPWVLLLAAVDPDSGTSSHEAWEDDVLAADYEFCLFDGVSRLYVAAEHAPQLREALSHPACVLDDFVSDEHLAALRRNDDLLAQTTHWRTLALSQWADAKALAPVPAPAPAAPAPDPDPTHHLAAAELQRERDHLLEEIFAYRQTLSWRVTRPLRAVRPLVRRVRAR